MNVIFVDIVMVLYEDSANICPKYPSRLWISFKRRRIKASRAADPDPVLKYPDPDPVLKQLDPDHL